MEMLVKKDNESSEQAMQGDWQYDGSMNGALYKTKDEWPSLSKISIHVGWAQLGR